MKIYLARHGETRLNKAHLMQGRSDEPLSETGIRQAQTMRRILLDAGEDLHFDAVYASPLQRAVTTATILADVPAEAVITDERLLEADFGKYEKCPYTQLGPWMTLYWRYPEYFPAPNTVETLDSMISRSHAFLKELEQKDYDAVLVACHGGILRPDASPTDGNSSAKRDPAGASHTGINSPAKKIMSGMTAIDSSVLCVTVLQA